MNQKLFSAIIFSLACLLCPGLVSAQSKEFSQTVPLQPGETVTVKTFKGSIHISAWERPEVAVFARITPPNDEDDEYAARVVEATRVEFRRRGNGVLIRSDYDDVPAKGGWFNQSKNLAFIEYEIQLPREVNLRVDDYKSEIEVYDLAGRLRIETYKGKLFASGLSGRLAIETYKGRADLQALRGSLEIETYKGEVRAEALEIDGASRLDTYKGEIELAVPQTQALTLVGETGRRGSFRSDFTLEQPPIIESRRKTRLNTNINQGGPRLEISTYKGDIRLTQL